MLPIATLCAHSPGRPPATPVPPGIQPAPARAPRGIGHHHTCERSRGGRSGRVCPAEQGLDKARFLIKSRIRIACWGMSAQAAQRLRDHGLHVTAQRLAVLRAVSERPHCTADDVGEDVRAEIGSISRQAVYDALGILAEAGLIRKIQPAGSPARYESRVGDNHHHMICRTCGETVDVDCPTGTTPCLNPCDSSGFQIEEAEVIYWGTCPKCLASPRRSAAG